MPIYEFHCKKCGREFEELVFSRQELVACGCGSLDVRKVMSRPAPARIIDFTINPDKGGRFRVDDATFHPSVKDPLGETAIHTFEFGKQERDRLDHLARE
jgi:putative FmdB family regulatory protein